MENLQENLTTESSIEQTNQKPKRKTKSKQINNKSQT